MVTIARNGITLAYDDRGAGDPIIVFVHGWTCDRSFFAYQAEYFAKRHRVVSVDLRGHGESDKPHGPYPIGAYADDIAYPIDQLDLGKVVAVGHSMGGLAGGAVGRIPSPLCSGRRHGRTRACSRLPRTFAPALRGLRTPSKRAIRNRGGS